MANSSLKRERKLSKKFIIKNPFAYLVLVAVLSGCDSKTEKTPQTNATSLSPPATSNLSLKQIPTKSEISAEDNFGDKGPALSEYTKLDHSDKNKVWATYIAVSRSKQLQTDEELLNLFSPAYYNESDAFKKREISQSELKRIKETLGKYSAQKYYSLEFGGENDPIEFGESLQPYNFDKKGFRFGSDNCFGQMMYSNPQDIKLTFVVSNPSICEIKVSNIETAKTIEAARNANFGVQVKGTIYFVVNRVNENNNNIDSTIINAKYQIFKGAYLRKDLKLITLSEE